MVKASSLANAITLVATTAYLFCGILTYIAPDLFWSFANSWFHAVNLEAVKSAEPMPAGSFIFGIVSFAAYVWVVAFSSGSLYSRFSGKRSVA